jgi:hypothetical protein
MSQEGDKPATGPDPAWTLSLNERLIRDHGPIFGRLCIFLIYSGFMLGFMVLLTLLALLVGYDHIARQIRKIRSRERRTKLMEAAEKQLEGANGSNLHASSTHQAPAGTLT